jgi:hypothetical protein
MTVTKHSKSFKRNKKYIIIMLVIASIIIWSNFILKLKKGLSTKDAEEPLLNKKNHTEEVESLYPDKKFTGKYKDPFIRQTKQDKVKTRKKNKSHTKKEPVKEKKRNQQNIKFRGIIESTAIIEYNNEIYFIQEGDSLEFGKIIFIHSDSVKINHFDTNIILKTDAGLDL